MKLHKKLLSDKPLLLGIATVFTLASLVTPFVNADRFEQQIAELSQENSQNTTKKRQLESEAGSLQARIDGLAAQINALQGQIQENQAKSNELKAQITEAEAELDRQRALLGENIRAMYLEGDITTLEMLASSRDLSEFVDKQQYRNSVKDNIKKTLDKITELKLKLDKQKVRLDQLIEEQKGMQESLDADRAEQNRILALNQSQRSSLDASIKENYEEIRELRRQQAIENARLFDQSGGVVNVPDTTGYPWANYRTGNWTHAGSCYYGDDIDPWGMCFRQCVSYVAWKVWKQTGYMPRWGGNYSNGYQGGNANKWDDNARHAGYAVDNNPGNGNDGTIAVSNVGTWGHVMYVESVNPNGTINVSQYNVQLTGTYSEAYNLSTSGLVFIHFR